MLSNCGIGKDSWESLGLQGDQTSQFWSKSTLNIYFKNCCWSRGSNTLNIWCKGQSLWKRTWCRERLKAGGEGDDRGWNGWMASPTRWTWVWVGSRSWWWTGKPVVLQSMGSHDWATEMNWLSHYRILSKSDLYGKSITLQVEHRLPQNTSIHRETLKDPPPLSENYCDI